MKITNTFYCVIYISFCLLAFGIGCKQTNNNKTVTPIKDTGTQTATVAKNPYKSVDQSPLDIAYCPDEYPQKKMKGENIDAPIARIIYSRPHKRGRLIFGPDSNSLCPYGKPWRLGANEATEIEFFRPVLINEKNIAPGRYIIYCIPHADKWEIVFNTNLNSWGLDIEPAKDIYKTEIPTQPQSPALEDFTMMFQETKEGADLLMAWDNIKVLLPLTFSK